MDTKKTVFTDRFNESIYLGDTLLSELGLQYTVQLDADLVIVIVDMRAGMVEKLTQPIASHMVRLKKLNNI